jgi:hypothetical protein
MNDALAVDASALREKVKAKYRVVAVDPHGNYHFHTGRPLSRRLVMTRRLSLNCRTARSRHLPVSEIRSRWASWSRASGSSISGPEAV